jgi:glycosyltransferase involved in cell wall biosynthesis
MITVTEPIIWGDEHVPVNTGLLETVVRAFPHERVRFHAESSHIALVRALIDRDDGARVEFRETKLPPRGADFRMRLRHDLGFVGRLMDEAAGSHLILASSCPSLIAALKLRGLRTAVRDVHIVLHGNLTLLWSWRSRNPLVRLTDLRTAMGLPSRLAIRYFVMEPAIRGELLATLPGLDPADVRLLPHPVSSVEASMEGRGELGTPVRIGFMGAASKEKGFGAFLKIARRVAGPGVEFHAVGRLGTDMAGEDMAVLATKPVLDGKVGRAEYVERLAGLHYVCMPYEAAHYRYSPSGVLADALALARPILAFDLPIFRDLFDRFGDIGHLCRDRDEMAELIRRGLSDRHRYRGQVEAMRRARAPRLAGRLKDELRMALGS